MDIIVLTPGATEEELKHLVKKLKGRGLQVNISKGTERTIIGVIGDTSKITEDEENGIRVMPGVEDVMRILKPYKLASREFKGRRYHDQCQRHSYRWQKDTGHCRALCRREQDYSDGHSRKGQGSRRYIYSGEALLNPVHLPIPFRVSVRRD